MQQTKQAKNPVRQTKGQQEKENLKILTNFFRESTVIMETAIEESHRKHPDLLKSSSS